jgi:hypothetical protein
MGQANTQEHDIMNRHAHTNEQLNTIIDVMYSNFELNLTSFFSMHSTAEILFDGVDLIYSFSIIYLFYYYYYFKR